MANQSKWAEHRTIGCRAAWCLLTAKQKFTVAKTRFSLIETWEEVPCLLPRKQARERDTVRTARAVGIRTYTVERPGPIIDIQTDVDNLFLRSDFLVLRGDDNEPEPEVVQQAAAETVAGPSTPTNVSTTIATSNLGQSSRKRPRSGEYNETAVSSRTRSKGKGKGRAPGQRPGE